MADKAVFEITQGDKPIATLIPEKRRYFASGQMMTEAAIDGSIWRDLYIALGEPVEEGAWAVRLQFKPMVRWLWLGGALIGFGALLTVADRRYRRQSTVKSAAISEATGLAG